MLSENEKGPKNVLPPFHAGIHTCTHPFLLRQKAPQGESCKDAWNSSESNILFRTAKKQKWALKLAMHWRRWFQQCRKSPLGGFLRCVGSQPKPSSVVALSFSHCSCNCSQRGQKKTLSMKHPEMFCNSVSELLPLVYYFASLILNNILIFIFLMCCYLLFLTKMCPKNFFKSVFPGVYLSSLLCWGLQWLYIFLCCS